MDQAGDTVSSVRKEGASSWPHTHCVIEEGGLVAAHTWGAHCYHFRVAGPCAAFSVHAP